MCANTRTFHLFHAFIALLFVLLMITKAFGDNKVPIRCLERERTALLQLKQGLIDDYGMLSSWSGEECCKWQGIKCSNLTDHVLTLDLHSPLNSDYSPSHPLRLRGNLTFSSLVELHHLTYLDLSHNDFFPSPFPESIGSLRELRYLNLSYSSFTGKIPHHQIGNLTHLQTLDLGFNNQDLNVDSLEWLSNLRAIRYLDLSLIDLSNTNWLQPIQNLTFLTELKLRYCRLRSPLTPLTNSSYMPLLSVIDLSENHFNSSSQPLFHWLYNLSSSLVHLDISSNNLLQAGPIPDVFSNMIHLQNLYLKFCNFEGMIPDSLGNLTRLQSLDLSENSLTGNLSEVLDKWSRGAKNSVEVLHLSSNEFAGSLPDFSRFSSLRELYVSYNKLNKWSEGSENSIEILDVSSNELTGSLPDLSRFSSLKEFDVSNNKLNKWSGGAKNPSLVTLYLSRNQITGSLPNQFSFPNLEYLDLSNNTITGRLPESIGQFSKLKHLDVSLNSFEGTITEIHFMKLSELQVLRFSFNSLVFYVSSDWIPPFQLDEIALESCNLGPHFPMWLETQNKFSELRIPNANISDAVPNWFWNLSPRLEYLNLARNQLSGVIPDLSSRSPLLSVMNLRSNQFSGQLPLLPHTIEELFLSKNRFVGSISSLCDRASIMYLDLSDNLLSGELPHCWKQNNRLEILNLANNNFTGEIPTSIGFLKSLQSLHLRNNNFTGKLPSSLKYCTMLSVVDLGGNNLSGKLPEWIGLHLRDLIVLSLSSNKFYGSIPPSICNLNQIKVLDLSQNRLSGAVPLCLNNFTSLIETGGLVVLPFITFNNYDDEELSYFEHAVVQWKGQSAEYGHKILEVLKLIDLSSNKLTGQIPDELASLLDLRCLNLSRNYFMGHIPEKIGEMKNLESLDLSRNLLSGEIPLGLGTVAFLSVLDLSSNHLSGRIPPGTQLEGFNSSVYAGNQQLCGLPLPNKCQGDGVALVPPTSKDKNAEEEDEDELITTGFYVTLVLGFAVGFWGVFGTLQLKQSWRRAFFQLLNDMKDRVYVAAAVNLARIKRMHNG